MSRRAHLRLHSPPGASTIRRAGNVDRSGTTEHPVDTTHGSPSTGCLACGFGGKGTFPPERLEPAFGRHPVCCRSTGRAGSIDGGGSGPTASAPTPAAPRTVPFMRIGALIFPTDLSIRPDRLAVELEGRGFESLWVTEHTHIPTSRRTPWPGGPELPEEYRRTLDPYIALTAAAGVTERLRLGTGITLVAQHDPIVLAKTIASLDLLSGGRVLVGIGVGWNVDEMEHHGVDPAQRRAIAREHVLAMRALWTEDEASFSGEHVQFSPSWSWPKPVSDPHPPIIMGGAGGPVTFRHVVEYCDGWMPIHGRRNIAEKLDELAARRRGGGSRPGDDRARRVRLPGGRLGRRQLRRHGLHALRDHGAARPATTTRCAPSTAPPTSSPSTRLDLSSAVPRPRRSTWPWGASASLAGPPAERDRRRRCRRVGACARRRMDAWGRRDRGVGRALVGGGDDRHDRRAARRAQRRRDARVRA